MKIIQPSFSIMEQGSGADGIYKQIELAGRTCYKSEDRITETSAKAFVERMVASKHTAMLEHGTVYFAFPIEPMFPVVSNGWRKYINNPYSKGFKDCVVNGQKCVAVTTNYRVLVENGWLEDLQYLCEPTEYHDKRVTVHFVCDRAIANEFVRHRVFSFAQESTRYVGSSSFKPIIEYACDSEEGIIAAYNQGFSMKNIADNGSLTEWEIRKVLLANNVNIRGLNSRGNRIEDYFSTIDTPEKAYLLGLIQTDGNIRKTEQHSSLTITQHKDYCWYIEDMLLNFSDKVCSSKDRNCRQISLGNKSIVNDLIQLGIVPNKVQKQTDKNIETLWNSIPDTYKGDFIRGCIDGDGFVHFFIQKRAINESCQIGFCSVKEILIDKIIEFIFNRFNYKCGKGKDGTVYKLWITDRQKAIQIGEYLYEHFQYPFGHPKKAAAWIKRLNQKYPIAEYKDRKFLVSAPIWLGTVAPASVFSFVKSVDYIENCYKHLRMLGAKPQDARAILPLSLKTELIMTGFVSDWEHFFDLRALGTTGAPHPDASKLAIPLYNEFKKRNLL